MQCSKLIRSLACGGNSNPSGEVTTNIGNWEVTDDNELSSADPNMMITTKLLAELFMPFRRVFCSKITNTTPKELLKGAAECRDFEHVAHEAWHENSTHNHLQTKKGDSCQRIPLSGGEGGIIEPLLHLLKYIDQIKLWKASKYDGINLILIC
jgi:hypothetical protein